MNLKNVNNDSSNAFTVIKNFKAKKFQSTLEDANRPEIGLSKFLFNVKNISRNSIITTKCPTIFKNKIPAVPIKTASMFRRGSANIIIKNVIKERLATI